MFWEVAGRMGGGVDYTMRNLRFANRRIDTSDFVRRGTRGEGVGEGACALRLERWR